MAAISTALTCIGVVNDSIYFQEMTELDADSFTFCRPETRHLCYSLDNQYLILNSTGQLEVKNLNDKELLLPESKFNIMIYKDSSSTSRVGRPVSLYANGHQKKVVCCYNYKIQVEEMDLQLNIEQDQHKALFNLIGLSSSHSYMFQSTMHPSRFLACERENGMLKLVLREKQDEVDEHCRFTLE